MKKSIVCFIIIFILLISSNPIMAQENYQIYQMKITEAMTDLALVTAEFSKDMQLVSKGELNSVKFLESAETYRHSVKELLKKVMSYESLTENKSYHADIVSLFSNWSLIIELIRDGVKENKVSKIESANTIMVHISKKMGSLAEETQSLN